MWDATNQFIDLLLKYLTDEDTCEKIWQIYLHPIMERRLSISYEKLDELLEVHKDHPMTTNSLFVNGAKQRRHESASKAIEERVKLRFQKAGQKVSADEITQFLSTLNASTTSNVDMDMIAAEDAFDHMNAFYEVNHRLPSLDTMIPDKL